MVDHATDHVAEHAMGHATDHVAEHAMGYANGHATDHAMGHATNLVAEHDVIAQVEWVRSYGTAITSPSAMA
ncbi:MAG: hypothetical protein J5I53_04365 [Bradyrhizobiaceae bacterium]|nr:hypothetical protein [Bradyrhizobiaceae bacterium]